MINPQPSEIIAVYRKRADGDYDFVAAFSRDTIPLLSQSTDSLTEIIETFTDALEAEGYETKLIEFSEPDMPSVWSS